MREEREVLKRHADAAMLGLEIGDVAIADADPAGIRLVDAGDQAQQHRLAAAGRAEDDDGLAARHLERQPLEDDVALEALADRGEREKAHEPALIP